MYYLITQNSVLLLLGKIQCRMRVFLLLFEETKILGKFLMYFVYFSFPFRFYET